jgi:glutamyl-tRNA reductase
MLNRLVLIGASHKSAPVEERERFSVPEGSEAELLHSALLWPGVTEAAVVSTCNRFEIVLCGDPEHLSHAVIGDHLARRAGVNQQWFERFAYSQYDSDAVRHIFRVTSSLDSLVIGEPQIMGQVKKAFAAAHSAGSTGPVLNRLFNQALHVGKRVRTETAIAEHAVSISYAAVELAKKVFQNLTKRSVLVVGAGKMAGLSIKHLKQAGIDRVYIMNRTKERAAELAHRLGGTPHGFDELDDLLGKVDIVISSTGSQHYVLKYESVKAALARRKYKPLFLIDIAVPRDIDPRCDSLNNVYLFDVDDLQQVVEANRANRRTEAVKAEEIVNRETDVMMGWMAAAEVVPTIVSLREKLNQLRIEELEKAKRALPDMSPEVEAAMDRLAHSLINKVLHEPTVTLKKSSENAQHGMLVAAVRSLFGLAETNEPKHPPVPDHTSG